MPNVLIMMESSRASGRQFVEGVAEYANHFGNWHFIWEPHGIEDLSKPWRDLYYDGIITRDIAVAEAEISRGIPMVLMQYVRESFPEKTVYIHAADEEITAMVVKHFLSRGFTNYAYCGYKLYPWSIKRGQTYEKMLAESGYETDSLYLDISESGSEPLTLHEEVVGEWLLALPKPVAVMAANDELGRYVVQICRNVGLRVPEDCAFVGVDNDRMVCGMSNPPLSSVEMKLHRAGYDAARLLDKLMRGGDIEQSVIEVGAQDLLVRRSSDIFAVEDVQLRKALQFIHNNIAETILVDDVARVSGVSRRALENRFRNRLDSTVKRYISELRADHVARVLSETLLSVEEIAEQCGFSETSHLTRFFKSIKCVTPSAYRKSVAGTAGKAAL